MLRLLLVLGCFAAGPVAAQQRGTVFATGSSTVAPFTNAVADRLTEGGAVRAEVRSVGTVGGFAEFCQGAAVRFPDIQNASRRMNFAEFRHCASRGVHEIMEFMIGYDGIVIAHRLGRPSPSFTRAELWLGLAKEVPQGGRLVPNPYRSWRDVAAHLPDWPIRVIGPPGTTGTRDSFNDLVLMPGCQAAPEIRAIREAGARRRACIAVREDGGWLDGGEDDEVIVSQVVDGPPGTLGVFGFSFLEANRTRIASATVDGVADSRETIASGRYPLARPLFLYVKRPNLDQVPALRGFIQEYVSERALGPEGYLVQRGLVALNDAGLARLRDAVRTGALMTRRPDE
nr:substrate-binding domain-containing protein [uncultured Roseococcus sp.]